ncbi:MAG TPA: phosphate-starvation-inducible PsiE family protein [Nitrospirales bacterium]|jgi:uncharacterized membrane protein (DUF373 family)
MLSTASSLSAQPESTAGFPIEVSDVDFTRYSIKGMKLVLGLLILTILVALLCGVIKAFLDLRSFFHTPVEQVLRQVIVASLLLLAVVEVFKTTLTYLTEGRVKVTFIVDTILVVMLTDVISQWFAGGDLMRLAALGGILLVLGMMRILAVRWSPARADCL